MFNKQVHMVDNPISGEVAAALMMTRQFSATIRTEMRSRFIYSLAQRIVFDDWGRINDKA